MAPRLALSVQTLGQALHRTLLPPGLVGPARRLARESGERTWRLLRRLAPASGHGAWAERDFDRRSCIDTSARLDRRAMARIASLNWVHDAGYAPAPIPAVRTILGRLDLDAEQFMFIDFGAGKGRTLFLAAELPFQRIIGVEYSPALFEVLQRNLASYRNPQQRCFDIQGAFEDATQFSLPPAPLVLFFHHPFGEPVFRKVIARIEQSLAESPREIWIIYYDPRCAELFDRSPWFERQQQGEASPAEGLSAPWMVFKSRAPDIHAAP